MTQPAETATPAWKREGEYASITYETSGPVARILHNRPQARNAQNTPLLDELDDGVRRACADSTIKVIIIGGVGDHFSAGHDLKEAINERGHYTVEQRWEYEATRYYGYALNIWDAPKPTIAQVQGACIAGAFMVANMCDLIVASEDAYFADPVCQTLASASVEVLCHPWVMGLRKAKEFLFTGARMSAAEAYRIGMVNRLTSREQLETATFELAMQIAHAPSFALSLTKRALNRTADFQGFRNALSAHFDTHQVTHVSAETRAIREAGANSAIGNGRAQR